MKAIKPVVEKTIPDNTFFLKNKLNLEVNERNKKLPNIYWILKLHKNPTKA